MNTHHEDTAEEIHGPYRWRSFDPANMQIHDGTLQEEAAAAMRIDPNEIEWAIEEYGRCDTQFPSEPGFGTVCWRPGPVEFDADDEPMQGGYEWPATEAPESE
jgi:hypothetical protein